MAIWTRGSFTSGIYRRNTSERTLPLAALFHVSVSSQIGTRNGAEMVKSPAVWPYGLEAFCEGFRHSHQVASGFFLFDNQAGLWRPAGRHALRTISRGAGPNLGEYRFRQRRR